MIKYLYIYSIKFNPLPASCMTNMSNKRLSVLNRKPDHRILIVLNSQYCRPGSGYLQIQIFFLQEPDPRQTSKKVWIPKAAILFIILHFIPFVSHPGEVILYSYIIIGDTYFYSSLFHISWPQMLRFTFFLFFYFKYRPEWAVIL